MPWGCVALAVLALHGLGGPATVAAQRRARTGSLRISGEHPGAEVFVDAELVGTLPLEPLALPVGEHSLRVSRPGFTEFTDVVFIAARRETVIEVDLMPVSMALTVETTPSGAQVFVDGRFSGAAPVEIDLLEGEHSLRVVATGYEDALRTVQARAGAAETERIELVALPEEVQLAAIGAEPPTWYERPWTWIAVGGAALVVAAVVVILVAVTADEPSELERFCGAAGGCVEIAPTF